MDPFAKAVAPRLPASSTTRSASRTPSTSTTCSCCPCACSRENPSELATTIASASSYVLVDEYQDTNRAQYQFVELLGGEHGNVVRRRRRRSVDLRLARRRHPEHPRLREGFPERARRAARGELPVARRRSSTLANVVISGEHGAPGKTLRATRPRWRARHRSSRALDERDEAEFVVEEIVDAAVGESRR